MQVSAQWQSYTTVAVMLVALLGGGFVLEQRDRALGNGYPPYSSLRADPAGCKVLYEALRQTGDVVVSRNYRDLNQWHGNRATLLLFGIPEVSLLTAQAPSFTEWEHLAKTNRIVLSIEPSSEVIDLSSWRQQSILSKRWGVELGKPPGKTTNDASAKVLWRRCFDRSQGWSVLASEAGRPVMLERQYGEGSIVLLSDSRLFGNEALAESPHITLLSRAIGSGPDIQFDESHFGISDTGTIMGLIRKYRLQGALAGLAVLAALFIWKTGLPFPALPPADALPAPSGTVAGRDAQQGFLGLLRRHIPPNQLIAECLREWRKASPRDARFDRMRAAATDTNDPVRAYALIRQQMDIRKDQSS